MTSTNPLFLACLQPALVAVATIAAATGTGLSHEALAENAHKLALELMQQLPVPEPVKPHVALRAWMRPGQRFMASGTTGRILAVDAEIGVLGVLFERGDAETPPTTLPVAGMVALPLDDDGNFLDPTRFMPGGDLAELPATT